MQARTATACNVATELIRLVQKGLDVATELIRLVQKGLDARRSGATGTT